MAAFRYIFVGDGHSFRDGSVEARLKHTDPMLSKAMCYNKSKGRYVCASRYQHKQHWIGGYRAAMLRKAIILHNRSCSKFHKCGGEHLHRMGETLPHLRLRPRQIGSKHRKATTGVRASQPSCFHHFIMVCRCRCRGSSMSMLSLCSKCDRRWLYT